MLGIINYINQIYEVVYFILNILLGVAAAVALFLPYFFRKQIKHKLKDNMYAFIAYTVSLAVVFTVCAEYFLQFFRGLSVLGDLFVFCTTDKLGILAVLFSGCTLMTKYLRNLVLTQAVDQPKLEGRVKPNYSRLNERIRSSVVIGKPSYNMLS